VCLPYDHSSLPSRLSLSGHRPVELAGEDPSPSHTAPNWESVARGGNTESTLPASSSITPADVITLYKQCVASGLLAHFTVQNCASYEEANFCCHFPVSADSSAPVAPSRRCWFNCRTVATSSIGIQTAPLEQPDEDCLLPPPQPSPHPNAPSSPVRTPSLMVPPPVKARKRRCEL
jgi:hypothetical protein